jgi:hypothetical protein
MNNAKYLGHALTEYGMLLGLLVILTYASLNSLGISLNGLFKSSNEQLQSKQFQNYVTLSFGANAGPTPSSPSPGQGKNDVPAINPNTGLPETKAVDSAAGTNTNVSSVDGSTSNAYATVSVAQKLSDLASVITDPALTSWYSEITRMAHLLAGAEGDHVGLKALQINSVESGVYNDGSAFRDIYNYQRTLSSLLANPPAGGNPEQIKQVSKLGTEAWDNAQPFTTQLSPYIKPDGTLDTQALASSKLGKKMSDSTYDSLIPYASLQDSVASALTDSETKNHKHVQTTLENATQLKEYE